MSEQPTPLQKRLYNLFLLDQQMRGLRKRLDAAERRLAAKSRKLSQYETQLEELHLQTQQAKAHVQSLEGEAETMDERITRLRDQINVITNNKEYSAALVEMNTYKLEKSKIEEQGLEHMTRVEELEAQLTDVTTRRDDQLKLVALAKTEVKTAREEVGDRLDEVTAKRNEAAASIPGDALRTFDRLVAQHDGEAMAPITEENRRRKEYHCGGCFLLVPVERLNSLMMVADALITCPSCGRILFLESALGESLSEALMKK